MSGPDDVNPLASLAKQPSSRPWPDAASLRAIARRRRTRRRVGVVTAGVVAVTTATLLVALPRDHHRNVTSPLAVPATVRIGARQGVAYELVADDKAFGAATPGSEQAVANAEQQFTLDLLARLNSADGTKNTVISPSSLVLALAMLQTGATGSTAAQIANMLHTGAMTALQQDDGWRLLMNDLTSAARSYGFDLQSANSLWTQQGISMVPGFLAAMQHYFKSGVWQVDFMKDPAGAANAFNAWVSAETHGKITKLIDANDLQLAVAILANATYFKAAWAVPFDPNLTQAHAFHVQSGQVTVPFMQSVEGLLRGASTPDYVAAALPYQSVPPVPPTSNNYRLDQGGRFGALIIMPTRSSLNQFVATLDARKLQQVASNINRRADVEMPKFDLADTNNLDDTLKALGMRAAFGPAELDRMFAGARPGDYYVSLVRQRATLTINEHGSEASAATAVVAETSSLSLALRLTFDRPFLYLIRDNVTGAILFTAEVRNPATS